jgi:CheY-like chemotaxis protein
VIEHLLQGFRVLVASDHGDFATLVSTLITVCGGLVLPASSALDAVKLLKEKPHAVLLDAAMPDPGATVPARAADLGVPVVAFMFRNPRYLELPPYLKLFDVRPLRSTDLNEVCRVLHEAAREA